MMSEFHFQKATQFFTSELVPIWLLFLWSFFFLIDRVVNYFFVPG